MGHRVTTVIAAVFAGVLSAPTEQSRVVEEEAESFLVELAGGGEELAEQPLTLVVLGRSRVARTGAA